MSRIALLAASIPLLFSPQLVEVLPAQKRITSRILFLVDVSGSMEGPEFSRAVAAVTKISNQSTDQMEVALIAFNDQRHRWQGIREEKVPAGWAALPSATAVGAATSWLRSLGAEGDTPVIPALQAALAEKRSKLSVVLVTDGQFHSETQSQILKAIGEAQAKRVKAKLGKALLYVYGVGLNSKTLTAIAKSSGGGYYQEKGGPPERTAHGLSK